MGWSADNSMLEFLTQSGYDVEHLEEEVIEQRAKALCSDCFK